MKYTISNKLAWEEAFERRKNQYGEDNAEILLSEELPFFNEDTKQRLRSIDFKGKTVAQFCCNNGRELLSLMQLGAKEGFGFDIAENILSQGIETAKKASINHVTFVLGDLLDIDEKYNERFDFIFFTIGAITWFKNLSELFSIVSRCLKKDGILLINDSHPFLNMMALDGEKEFDPKNINKISHPYFEHQPWIGNTGISYISGSYESKTLTSFAHTISDIISALLENNILIHFFKEYDYDLGYTSGEFDGMHYPLSYLLLGKRVETL